MWVYLSILLQILFPVHKRRQSVFSNRNIYSSLDQRAGVADKVFSDIGAVFGDPFHRDSLFFVADKVDVFQSAFHGVRGITLTFKSDHLSGFHRSGRLYTKFTGKDTFLLVCLGEHGCGAALAYVEFYRAGFDTEAVGTRFSRYLPQPASILWPKASVPAKTVVFADESAVFVMDSLGYTDDNVAVFSQRQALTFRRNSSTSKSVSGR